MKYPFFASFIVFGFLFSFSLKKRTKNEKKYVENFWERERLADSTRRKSLEALDYIAIPFHDLPMDVMADLPEVQEFHKKLQELSRKKLQEESRRDQYYNQYQEQRNKERQERIDRMNMF